MPAVRLCPQYNFRPHEANFEHAIANFRAVLGDAAVDDKIFEAGHDVSALIAGGQKEKFCDGAENIDMGLSFGGN